MGIRSSAVSREYYIAVNGPSLRDQFEVDNSYLSGPLLIHLFMLCLSAGRVDGISPGVTEITRSAWIEDENDVDQIAKLVYAQMEWVVQLAEWSVDIVKKVRDVAAVRVAEL